MNTMPSWEQAKHAVFPWPEPQSCLKSDSLAQRPQDTLVAFITKKIKLYVVCLWNDILYPINDFLIKTWNVSWAAVRLAIEENMMRIMRDAVFKKHVCGQFSYYTLHHALPVFNSVLPFFKPFQAEAQKKFGGTFYFSVPERTTSVFFAKSALPMYVKQLRNDILLTHDCSARALSTELIEISPSGLVALLD
ncbi:MAG: hypothetical protein NC176_04520 [Treponema brennaborense]|nr:hypothetical protein [Prevotella sp.]MCM1407734.1 hypothetical protein [Treponema brennaborense]